MSPGRDVGKPQFYLRSRPLLIMSNFALFDVLGLADTHENDKLLVYEVFKEQLERSQLETGKDVPSVTTSLP